MARREMVVLEDDLDGGEATETVRFGLDGVLFEIDLNSKNAKKLRDAIAGYVEVARKIGRGGVVAGGRTARGRSGSSNDREQNRAIREWAKKAGWEMSERGRIPAEVMADYQSNAGRKAG